MCTCSDFGHRHLEISSLLPKDGRGKINVGEGNPGGNHRVLSIRKRLKAGTPLWRWTVILSAYTAFAQNAGQALLILFVLQ